jgi:hypothetical protein
MDAALRTRTRKVAWKASTATQPLAVHPHARGEYDTNDLRSDQAAALGRAIRRSLNYYSRLRTRMERKGFPPGDPLFRLVDRAYDAVHHLSFHVHYLSCGSGVGEVPRKREK